jgi:hypothetical protein
MISRSFNRFYKLAYQMSKDKKAPKGSELKNYEGIPPEVI